MSFEDQRRDRASGWIAAFITGLILCGILLVVVLIVMTAGCTEPVKTAALDAISPVVVLKGSTQYERMFPDNSTNTTNTSTINVIAITTEPTPYQTVTVIPTKGVHTVNPFDAGERWEGQWFRWTWDNASGYQTADRGIVIYRHVYLNTYTYWDDAWGNYITVAPSIGYRFLAVYIHEEDFSTDNSGLWGYDADKFNLQYDNTFHPQYDFQKVYHIYELEDTYRDYYKIASAPPFGIQRIYGGLRDASTGGYHTEEVVSLWSGPGNSWDGYLLYEVPVSLTDHDFRIVGNFAGIDVNWRFDADDTGKKYPITETGTLPVSPAKTEPTYIGSEV